MLGPGTRDVPVPYMIWELKLANVEHCTDLKNK